MKDLKMPKIRPSNAKMLAIIGEIDNLCNQLYRAAKEAAVEDGRCPAILPDWDMLNDLFMQWYEGWNNYVFERMKWRFPISQDNEI